MHTYYIHVNNVTYILFIFDFMMHTTHYIYILTIQNTHENEMLKTKTMAKNLNDGDKLRHIHNSIFVELCILRCYCVEINLC